MLTIKIYQEAKKEFDSVMADITFVQQRLNHHGYKCVIDGKWATETQRVLGEFQKAKGLKLDHTVGPLTMAALKKDKAPTIQHFRDEEFRCKCGGKYCNGFPSKGISMDLKVLLEKIRAEVNRIYGKDKVVIINSGYRCPTWNSKVGGASGSRHKVNPADAADIRVPGVTPKQLGGICDKLNPGGGVGLGGATIVHVDTRPGKARWYYN